VLNNLSFTAKAGERIAIVGSSGAGKSTLAQLLLRFYNLDSGTLLIDGKDSQSYDLHALRNNMAMVPQDVILFGGTIRENIAYGKPNAEDFEIIQAAQRANAWEFIQTFSEGLATVVGERGVKLSGGQRQRIAIARALLKDPRILLLDEATSALDSESERVVQAALDELMKGRTSIIIAHRLSTIRDADKIVVLDKGQVVEQGTHTELMQIENGFYKHLSVLQGREV
jgi:ABC-type multidrug transport system fused ATPase/permease subunit